MSLKASDFVRNPKKSKELSKLIDPPSKNPTPDHYSGGVLNTVHQMDLLNLPTDKGKNYALVVVDLATRLTDAEPIKGKSASTVKKALEKIYKRSRLSPPDRMEVDQGSEFKGITENYLENEGTFIFRGIPGRTSQRGMVENMNRLIGKAITLWQQEIELRTGKPFTKWVNELPGVISELNKMYYRDEAPTADFKDPPKCDPKSKVNDCDVYPIGLEVYVALDQPKSMQGKKLHGTFRTGDIRFSPVKRKIENIFFRPDAPVRYAVSGITNATFTKNQLRKV